MRGARELRRGRDRAWALAGFPAALPAAEEQRSYAVWFVLVIAILLLLLAFQAWVAVRRDRRLAREREDREDRDAGPAYVEDAESPGYAVDALGDVDDLQVQEYTARPRVDAVAPADDSAPVDEAPDDEAEPQAPDEQPDAEPEVEPQPAEDPAPEPTPRPKPKPTGNGKGKGKGKPRKES